MSISDLYNKTFSSARLAAVADTNKKAFQTNIESFAGTLHPVETSQQQLGDGAFYKTFKIWCDVDLDIKVGDRVVDGDDVYTVSGVSDYNFGRNPHLRLTVSLGA